MAVVATNLTADKQDSSASSFSTASISPTSNNLIMLSVVARRGDSVNPTEPSISGNSLTWVKINEIQFDTAGTSRKTIFLFRAMGASPSSGTVSIDFGAQTITNCNWSIDQFSNVDTSGTNGSGAIVQSATNKEDTGDGGTLTVTLSAFSSTNNATFGCFACDPTTGTMTVGSGFTKLGAADSSVAVNLGTEWRADNDTTVDATFDSGTGESTGGIAVEIKSAPSTTTQSPNGYMTTNTFFWG